VSYVPSLLSANRRLLDVFLQMQHYDKWQADLDLVKELGFNTLRYSVPWYKAEPKQGVYDWSWIDKPVEYLVEKLKIVPIMDLMHYGTPAWMAEGVTDDRFPDAIARYAGAMAEHFKGLVNHYSPQNEPGLTCLFCGLTGRWPPYQKTIEGWAKVGVRVAKAMVLEMETIRGALSDAVIVSVDPWFYGVVDSSLLPVPPQDPVRRELLRAAAAYPASLAYGKVGMDHPFARFLCSHGVTADELAWFQGRARTPDILGCNCYPGMHAPAIVDRPSRTPEEIARELIVIVKHAILESQTYFNLPVFLTETSDGLTDEAKIAYMNALYDMAVELRRDKVPLVGINWWPLFDTIQWDYRENVDKPLVDFIYPGGWNNGIYKISPQSDGDLKRLATRAVEGFQKVLHRHMP
jgi:beta-glucosidase